MRIESKGGVGAASRGRAAGGADAAAFSLPAEAAPRASGVAGLGHVQALGAALALQMEAIDPERRRRQLQRGEQALGALDRAALALLGAASAHTAEAGLREVLALAAEPTGEAGLDEVLAQIEQRAAVELAKFEVARRRASAQSGA